MGKVIMSGIVPQLVAPVTGILASDLAVGSTVKLMENGSPVEYLVVHNGLPSSMYDSSCDGLWLLRKDIYEQREWHSSNWNDYANSTIHSYLNNTFLSLFDDVAQGAIKQAKIPYDNDTSGSSVASGSNGLSAKLFLLGGIEVGFSTSVQYMPNDGACLSYFNGTTYSDTKRWAYLNGSLLGWWLRSAYNSTMFAWYVDVHGNEANIYTTTQFGIRPALILPKTAIFDEETLILKGVT